MSATRGGVLLSFEGGEASGKSLQAERLAKTLRDRGVDERSRVLVMDDRDDQLHRPRWYAEAGVG